MVYTKSFFHHLHLSCQLDCLDSLGTPSPSSSYQVMRWKTLSTDFWLPLPCLITSSSSSSYLTTPLSEVWRYLSVSHHSLLVYSLLLALCHRQLLLHLPLPQVHLPSQQHLPLLLCLSHLLYCYGKVRQHYRFCHENHCLLGIHRLPKAVPQPLF